MTNLPIRVSRIAAFCGAAFALASAPLSAAQTPGGQSYLITSAVSRPAGPVVTTEILNVSDSGEISAPPTDPAVACFITAQGILADHARPAQSGAALEVSFNGNPVAIPLQMSAAAAGDGLENIAVNGGVEGAFTKQPEQNIAIVVQGNVVTRDHALVGARFVETSLFTATHVAIGQSMCTLAHLIPAAGNAAPAAPAAAPVET